MKAVLHRPLYALIAALVFHCAALFISLESYAGAPVTGMNDSILVHKRMINRSHKVALYPDAMQKVLFFTVKGDQGKVYQLYLFDVAGKLIEQREVRNKQTTYITDFEKGMYVFDVFCDDERIGNGEIAVR